MLDIARAGLKGYDLRLGAGKWQYGALCTACELHVVLADKCAVDQPRCRIQ